MPALTIARACFATLVLALVVLGVNRLVQDVPDPEGHGSCGVGWTVEYEGACDSALKARQVEVLSELVSAAAVAVIASRILRPTP